jgi:type I restriction enzyme S subunit
MKVKNQRYEKYKDSEIRWLGEVPDNWNIRKAKSVCSHIKDGTHGSFKRVDIGYPLLSVRNIVNSKFTFLDDDSLISEKDYREISNSLKIKTGDLQLAIVGATMGKVAIVPEGMSNFVTQRSLATLRPIPRFLNSRFFFYFANSSYFQDTLWSNTSYSAQPGIYLNSLSSIDILAPTLKEQKAIATYLDTKIVQIDRKIDLLTQKAQRYEELKRSLINETVTGRRRIDNGELTIDSEEGEKNCQLSTVNYPLYKDSGIEWIGDIPEHWEIHRIKDFTYVKGRIGWQGLRSSDFLDTGDYYCVTGTDLIDGLINWSDCYFVSKARYEQDKYIQLKVGDLLITKDGTIGKTALVDALPKEATLNSGLFVTRPLKDKYLNVFLYWILNSSVFRNYIDLTKGGSTIQHLYQNVFDRFLYCCPPLTEQKEISDYLSRKSSHIDQIIQSINMQIETQKELRKTLINDVVTGKIKVIDNGE